MNIKYLVLKNIGQRFLHTIPMMRSNLIECIGDGLILLDRDYRVVGYNSSAKAFFSELDSNVIGKPIAAALSRHPGMAENFLGTPSGYSVVTMDANGNRIYVQFRVSRLQSKDGQLIGRLITLRDVTGSQEKEEQLAQYQERLEDLAQKRTSELVASKALIDRILASMPNGVLVVDESSNIVLANAAFCSTFSVKKEEAEGRPLNEVVPLLAWSVSIPKTLAGEGSNLHLEFKYRSNGKDRTIVASMFRMQKDEVLIILDDVTNEREMKDRLYLTDRLASIGQMASGIAHEVNNPLTSIIALSQMLTNEDVPDNIKEDLKAIHSESRRVAAIVKNLLTFARKNTPTRQPTQINSVVEDALHLRAFDHTINDIRVNRRLDADLPEIMADALQIQQVMLNIIRNAEQAMMQAHGRGTLTIATQKANKCVKVTFTDDGPGIAPEDLPRLFDPFFTTKEAGKGTGLGLSICHGIVRNHGGTIYAESQLGQGATFVVELPTNSSWGNQDIDVKKDSTEHTRASMVEDELSISQASIN